MPQPPVAPPPTTQPPTVVHQTPVEINPVADFNNKSKANSNSVSEAENVVHQSGSLTNYQVNSSHLNYAQFSNGARLPVPNWSVDLLYNPHTGDSIIKTGLNIPLGGKSKKLVHASAHMDNVARMASVCTGLVKSGVVIDYKMVPQLSDCQYFQQKTIVARTPSNEVAILKQQMKEQLALIKKQQQTIEAFQLRLIQLQHKPNTKPTTW